MKNNNWFQITNKAGDNAEVSIFDEIGGYGVYAKDFIAALKDLGERNVEVVINSPGGSVFEGLTIFNALQAIKDRVTTRVDGLAASIASVIALAGSKVRMAKSALMFVHNPSGVVMGPASEMRKTADALDKIRDSIAGIYADKTGADAGSMATLMDEDTWLTASEAKAFGFADELVGGEDATAHFDVNTLTMFNDDERAALAQAKAEGCFNEFMKTLVCEKKEFDNYIRLLHG